MSQAALVGALAALAGSASAAGFTNGGFETGDITGWTQGGGFRGSVLNPGLSPAYFNGGGGTNDGGRSQIMNVGDVDPNVGAAIGGLVQSGAHSLRIENTINGGYATYVDQTVNNYTDPDIYFAWKSVLQGAHGATDAATMIISLKDLTTNTELIHREYNAASGGGGVDARFSLLGGDFYTPVWQIEHIAIDSSLSGHSFDLSVLAADCEPTGHFGYVYLDGFGAVAPPGGIPEPSSWALLISGLGLVGTVLRRRRASQVPAIA